MFCMLKSNYAIFSNYKVTKIESSAFYGTPVIDVYQEPSAITLADLRGGGFRGFKHPPPPLGCQVKI